MTDHRPTQKKPRRRHAIFARRAAARRLLTPHQFKDSLSLNPAVSLHMGGIAGLQAGLALLVAIVLLRHSLWPELIGFSALGALAALFGRFSPLTQRHSIVWICAAQLTAAVLITSVASYLSLPAALMVLIVAFIAAVSSIIFTYWNLGGPGAVIIVFAAGAAMSPVDSWTLVAERSIATAIGGAVA